MAAIKKSATTSTMNLGVVRYAYISKDKPGIKGKDHVLSGGKIASSIDRFCVLKDAKGRFVLPWTEQEKAYIRKGLGLIEEDLNTSITTNEYLGALEVEMPKHGLALNTEEPLDLLIDTLLRGYTNIFAPSEAEINNRASYRYVRVRESEKTDLVLETSSLKKKGYAALEKLEESRERMIMFLLNNKSRVHPTISDKALKSQVTVMAEANFSKFLSVLSDPLFLEKGILNMAVILEVVQVKSNLYSFEGKPLCFSNTNATLTNAAVYLGDKENGEIKMLISQNTLDAFIGN